MNKPILHDPLAALLAAPGARLSDSRFAERRPADVEMARILKTAPLQMASDPFNGGIAHWKHGALHDVVEPMTDHVIMTYPTGVQRLERRTGKSVAIGTARSGVVTIIPAGSSARWDIPGLVDVIQLYLPHTTLERVGREGLGNAARAINVSTPYRHRIRGLEAPWSEENLWIIESFTATPDAYAAHGQIGSVSWIDGISLASPGISETHVVRDNLRGDWTGLSGIGHRCFRARIGASKKCQLVDATRRENDRSATARNQVRPI